MSSEHDLEEYAKALGQSECLRKQIIELLTMEYLMNTGRWPSVKKVIDLCKFAGYTPSAGTVLTERGNLEEVLKKHLKKSKFEKNLKDSSRNLREKTLK